MSSAIGWGALAVVGGASIAGGAISAKGAKSAAKIQAGATAEAGQIVRDNYQDTKQTLQPYTDSGIPSLNRRNVLLGLQGTQQDKTNAWNNVYDDPVLTQQNEFVRDDVNRGASATGQLRSGNRLAALSDRLQRIKYDFGQQYLNRLDTGVNTGYGAAAATGGVAANAANTQANLVAQGGAANAQGRLGVAQSYSSGLADIGGIAGYGLSGGQNQGFREQNFGITGGR